MADDSSGERSEEASAKKRKDTRDKGTVAKSTEVNSVLVLLTGIYLIKITAPTAYISINNAFKLAISHASNPDMGVADFLNYTRAFAYIYLKIAIPIAGGIMVVGLLANIMQIGFLLTFKPLVPKFEKINPFSGIKRMFAMRSLVEAVKSVAKMSVIAFIAYITIRGEFGNMIRLNGLSVGAIWLYILAIGFKIVIRVAMVLVLIAILDFAFQRHENESKMKMTKQEVKEERKQMDGDPQIKARIRSLQREMSRRRMMKEVPKATVVVTNPTHLAIAIKYEASEMETPIVVAKGKLNIAEKIKKMAIENDIPIVEDKPLARAMYDQVEPGDEIPLDFFNAVAEILAYVYKLKGKVTA